MDRARADVKALGPLAHLPAWGLATHPLRSLRKQLRLLQTPFAYL